MKPNPLMLLRRQHRAALWGPSLGVAVAGAALAVGLIRGGAIKPWGIPIAIAVAVLALLLRVLRQRPLVVTARDLDDRLSASNRFEVLADLDRRTDPMAVAIRQEAASHWAQNPPRGLSSAWSLSWIALAVAAVAAWVVQPSPALDKPQPPPTVPVVAAARPAAPAREPQPPPAAPTTLVWRSPLDRITAIPEEIIPLGAEADSADGLGPVTLHVSVNGKPVAAFAVVARVPAGIQPLVFALQLHALKVRAGDTVEYHITARPSAAAGAATVSSAVQTIKIRAVEDYLQPTEAARPIQFGAIRPLPQREQTPAGRLDRLSAEQKHLAERLTAGGKDLTAFQDQARLARELEQLARDPSVQPPSASEISAAAADAKDAARQLNEQDPQAALEPATRAADSLQAAIQQRDAASRGRAQQQLAEVQAAMIRVAASAQSPRSPDPEQDVALAQSHRKPDPTSATGDPTSHRRADLRAETPANRPGPTSAGGSPGAAGGDPSPDPGPTPGGQGGSGGGGAGSGGPGSRKAAAGQAGGPSGNALGVGAGGGALGNDPGSAQGKRRPAASVPESGQTPVAGGERAGRSAAMQAIADQTAAAAGSLHRAAAEEQQNGSASAAAELERTASAIDGSGLENGDSPGSGMPDPAAAATKLTALGQTAADAQVKLGNAEQFQQRARDEAGRDQANLDRAATSDPASTRDLYWHLLAAQQVANSSSGDLSHRGAGQTLVRDGKNKISEQRDQRGIGLGHNRLAAASVPASAPGAPSPAEPEQRSAAATDLLVTGTLDDAPPAYRGAVSDYFESLAREANPPAR